MSERALAERDTGFFGSRLPPGELWRLYPTFRPETAFLDIETTSLSPYEGIVTVVTVHGGGATRTFVADDTLEELPAWLQRFGVLVTFNGRIFDVPFLQTHLPHLRVPPAHIDLRYVLYRLGYAGGLKRIEQNLGLGDRQGVEGIHGLDAVRLWEAFRRGNKGALDRLVKYNRADTVNLEPLLDFATRELTQRLLGSTALAPPESRAPVFV
ncbi:MAG: ribonuclease H-like domain-containing protein [Candidatus Lutacidiplasmatales archaeon]